MIRHDFKQRLRRAVTLVEVIFAIGVILIGLLGLLSILPLAGKRSQDSVSLSTGPQIANRVLAELKSNRFLSRDALQALNTAVDVNTTTVPFCIDPIFVSSPLTDRPAIDTNVGYYAGNFPFFDARHNPLADPLTVRPAQTDPIQPRMYRVGLKDSLGIVPGTVARVFSENRDDLINTQPDDRSLPVRLTDGEIQPISTGLEYGKRIPSGEFSWIVTVNPLPGGVYASVAVVVMRNRTLEVEFPPAKNNVGERLFAVISAQGFQGGSGGIVEIQASQLIESSVGSGDWLMLSTARSANGVEPPDYHWYRVVSVDDATLEPNDATWTRKILLDGPDRAFDFEHDDNRIIDAGDFVHRKTYATTVSGVVCVKEAVLKLSEI